MDEDLTSSFETEIESDQLAATTTTTTATTTTTSTTTEPQERPSLSLTIQICYDQGELIFFFLNLLSFFLSPYYFHLVFNPILYSCYFIYHQLCVSSVYQVPILLFEAHDHATGAPVTSLETLHEHLPIKMASNPTHAYVTQVEHPFTERPIFAIHPCRTADIVKDLIASCQENTSRRTTRSVDDKKKEEKISPIYLAVWMNVYLNSLGATNLRLSSLEYKRIIDVLSSSSSSSSSSSTTTTTTTTSTSSTTNLKGSTLSDYSVREATLYDLTTLHLFEQELIKYERPFASNLKEDPIHYYNIKDLIERKDAILLVVEVKTSGEGHAGRLIGSGYALIKESPPHKQPDQFAYLGFMYVAPDYRGQGLNGVVMQQLIDWSKERGIVEIQLDVFAENQSALRAYEKIGFQPDLLKMRLRR